MKAIQTIAAMMVVAGLAAAQSAAPSKPKAPASQTVAGQTAAKAPAAKAPAAKPAAAAAAKPMVKPAAKPMAASPMVAKKKPAAMVSKPVAKPASTKAADAIKPTGKRDPFVNPVVRSTGGGPGVVCGAGQRCLMISEVQLQGIVKTQQGMIAVVVNSAKRTYFLKENDPVYNGMVSKITGDTVIFRENVIDNMGKETTREVVKRVTAPVV